MVDYKKIGLVAVGSILAGAGVGNAFNAIHFVYQKYLSNPDTYNNPDKLFSLLTIDACSVLIGGAILYWANHRSKEKKEMYESIKKSQLEEKILKCN